MCEGILSSANDAVKALGVLGNEVILVISSDSHKSLKHFTLFEKNKNYDAAEISRYYLRFEFSEMVTDRLIVRVIMPRIVLNDQALPASNSASSLPRTDGGGASSAAHPRGLPYWALTRRPIPSLTLVLPLMLAYELGVLWQGGTSAGSLRTGADAWMRHVLASLGLVDQWLPPLALVVILLGWQVASPRDWRFSPAILPVMVLESCVLALALVGVSRLIDMGFSLLDQHAPPVLSVVSSPTRMCLAPLIGYLGAGVYEEALFRLVLVPLLFAMLRLLQTPQILASALAVTGSALLFSLAHHAGTPGESFTWFAFVFRWMAGVFFAWVFVIRGFGIAVGTHTAYDILVGWVGWHL